MKKELNAFIGLALADNTIKKYADKPKNRMEFKGYVLSYYRCRTPSKIHKKHLLTISMKHKDLFELNEKQDAAIRRTFGTPLYYLKAYTSKRGHCIQFVFLRS